MGFGKDGKGAILREIATITLGALAVNTVVKDASGIAIEDDFRLIKIAELLASIASFTAGEGPVAFGICDDELSVAEIAEALNVDGPLDRNDRLQVEQAERPVWLLGQFDPAGTTGICPKDGVPMEKVLRWTFSNPEGWCFFAYNMNTTTALTTGSKITIAAKHFGVWVQ